MKKINNGIGFSFISKTNIIFMVASFNLNIKRIISERNNPKLQSLTKVWSKLRYIYYKKADILTVNSIDALDFHAQYVDNKKIMYLPNLIKPLNHYKEKYKKKYKLLQ